ncbi:MAG: VWA domain-containing protein [Acidobacteriota bacterium]
MRLWLAGALMAGTAAGAQQTPAPIERPPAPIERQNPDIPTIKIESRLVNVALNVMDEHGAPVPGLTATDFELAEDDKPQRIAVFDTESVTPLEIVLAIDASESLYDDSRLAKDAAKNFAQTIVRKQDRIDLMSFADDVSEVVPFTNNVHAFESGVGRIQRGEATAMYDAIYLASQRLGDTPSANGQRRVLVLVTDGENTTRHGSYPAALEQAQKAGAMVYSLIIVPVEADAGRDTGGEHALIQLARDTGGRYYYVANKHDLAPAFEHVSDDLRTQYTVGYYAPRKGEDEDGLRRIRLQMKDPALRAKYTLRYRTAYYANR